MVWVLLCVPVSAHQSPDATEAKRNRLFTGDFKAGDRPGKARTEGAVGVPGHLYRVQDVRNDPCSMYSQASLVGSHIHPHFFDSPRAIGT